MTKWMNLTLGIVTGYMVLAALYYWIERGDTNQATILLACAVSTGVLIGNVRIGKSAECARNAR